MVLVRIQGSIILKTAGFKQSANAEEIIYNESRGINKEQILSLLKCDFIRGKNNLLIYVK